MPTTDDDTLLPFSLPPLCRKKVSAAFDGGTISSDGGVFLLAGADKRLGLIDRLASHVPDSRDPGLISHSIADILRERVFAIACGYPDGNDLDVLRKDPAFKMACGRLPETGLDMASQPTLSRLENTPNLRDPIRLSRAYMLRSRRGGDRATWAIKPDQYVGPDSIIADWDDVLRLVATIKLKESTASDIFRRLNSYSRQHSLYTALKAFGRIVKSMFILRYIDDVELRMAIENLLNRIELGNRFTRAIAVGNPREFSAGDKEEQEIAETCNRLIKNAIVCWNYLLLEHRLNQASMEELRAEIRAAVANHSVISWGHINLLGEYDFSDEKLRDSVGIPPPKIPPRS